MAPHLDLVGGGDRGEPQTLLGFGDGVDAAAAREVEATVDDTPAGTLRARAGRVEVQPPSDRMVGRVQGVAFVAGLDHVLRLEAPSSADAGGEILAHENVAQMIHGTRNQRQ